MQNTNKKSIIILAIAAIIIVAGVAAAVIQIRANRTRQQQQQQAAQQASVPLGTKQDAADTQIVAGFPKQLLLDSTAQVQSSYQTKYAGGTQYTATFTSSRTPSDLYSLYSNYFTGQKSYNIKNKLNQKDLSALYAETNNATFNFQAGLVQGKTSMTLTYFAQDQ